MNQPYQINLLHPLASLDWRECSAMPLDMCDAQAVLLGDKVYMGGGDMYSTAGSLAALLIYNFTVDSWDLLDTPTEDYALTTYNSQLVLVGGTDPTTRNITNQLWVLDEQQYWTHPLPPMKIQCCRASAVSVDHHLIVAGGLDDELDPLDVVQVYDGYQWKKAQRLPKAGHCMKSSVLNGVWYMVGGDEQGKEVIYTSLFSLIATTSSDSVFVWKKLPNVPLEWATPVKIGKTLATVGGNFYSSAIYVYFYPTNSWVYVEDLPVACHSTCTVVLPTGELLAVGGETERGTFSHAFRTKIQVTSYPDGYITMSALERLKEIAGISICKQLAPKLLRMAEALHLDFSTVSELKTENNPIEGSKAMFEAWLAGKGASLPTWKTLLEKLRTIQMEELAQKIEDFFSRTPINSPSASLISEWKKEDLDFDLSAIEKKEQQTQPDCRDVAVQIRPDCQEMAVQTTHAVKRIGSIPGVEIVGETEFRILKQKGSFVWKGYGLRLHVPIGSLTASMEECRINIQVGLSGQFQLPKDSDFLSPVFWLSASCKFTKPVILEIQHCTFQENETVLSDLSFVSAKCSQKDLPYTFRQVDGGVFTTHSSYGSIQLSHFSGFAVTGRKSTPRSYCAHLYQTMKQMYDWRFYFVITQDLEAKNMVVKQHYGHIATQEATLRVRFGCSAITLDIPEDGLVTREGWRITPRSYPTISRKDADQFEPGQWIPECQLIVQWEGQNQRPPLLRHKVKLIGAKKPYNFIFLTLNPAVEGLHSNYPAGLQSQPELSVLMNKVAAEIPSKWRDVGLQLGIDHGVLEGIAPISPGDTNLCYSNVFTWWKNQNSATYPYTWSTLVQALESQAVGEKRLADKIRNEVTGNLLQ